VRLHHVPARAKLLAQAEQQGLQARRLDQRRHCALLTHPPSIVGGAVACLDHARAMFRIPEIFTGPLALRPTQIVNQVLVYCNLASIVEAITLCQKPAPMRRPFMTLSVRPWA
jgi:hypothetical protein